MNPIKNNVLVRTCKMCFKRKKITPVLGSGEVFFQEPYQCISCCFKPIREEFLKYQKDINDLKVKVQQKNQNIKSSTKNIEEVYECFNTQPGTKQPQWA